MRSWLSSFGSSKSDDGTSDNNNSNVPPSSSTANNIANAGSGSSNVAVKDGGSSNTGGISNAPSDPTSTSRSSSTATTAASSMADALSSFAYRGRYSSAAQEAEIDRKVSLSARNLCYGVQRIVMAAKGKSGVEWKVELLTLLGGSDSDNANNRMAHSTNASTTAAAAAGGGSDGSTSTGGPSDIDVLLAAPKTEKFVMRCLENELPPNMIHCLRLLRVLELQHASQASQEYEQRRADGRAVPPSMTITPISSKATTKVSQLLCTLCTSQSVGEQLRPHLFGLLALSGASYPSSGVHVARAASQVIIAFAEHCLSPSLVSFLHDRKMIIHMTDDIKELTNTDHAKTAETNNASGEDKDDDNDNDHDEDAEGKKKKSTAASLSLYGIDAEAVGLWAISLSTVVHLVVQSCRHGSSELIKDFDTANGHEVLREAISKSQTMHGKKLMELLPLLATCKVSGDDDEKDSDEILSMADPDHTKLALNCKALSVMEELMYTSIPMLDAYEKEIGKRPSFSADDENAVCDIAAFALKTAIATRFAGVRNPLSGGDEAPSSSKKIPIDSSQNFDISTDLLLSSLQLYSEHVRNYALVEDQTHILALYILAFPTFEDENLKVLILKTVEFVVTGVTGSKALQPFSVLSEVFVAICKSLLNEGVKSDDDDHRNELILRGLFADTDLINESLEKLFRFDGKVGPQIMQSGKITRMVDAIAQILLKDIEEKKSNWLITLEDEDGTRLTQPPSVTPFDSVCAAILRVLSLVMGYQAKRGAALFSCKVGEEKNREINDLLVLATKELGDEAATAAFSVFQSILSCRESLDLLCEDLDFVFRFLNVFNMTAAKCCGVEASATTFVSTQGLNRKLASEIVFTPTRKIDVVVLRRITGSYSMLRNVMESSSLAREAFRLSGGFDVIIKVLLSLGGSATMDENDEVIDSLMNLFRSILSVVDAAIGLMVKDEPRDTESTSLLPIGLPPRTLVDPVSSQYTPLRPTASNLYYIRLRGFYLDLAIAISQTKIMEDPDIAVQIIELAMSHMDPSFNLTRLDTEKGNKAQTLHNPDAARLVLGLAVFLPDNDEGFTLAKRAFDQIIRLCDPSRLGSTLSQIANCGMIWSITNPKEFCPILDDTSHPLYPRFTLLLRRIAAFSMSYNDFVSLVRSIAGPLLREDKSDMRIRLPVISSSVRQSYTLKDETNDASAIQEKENDFCRRLESLCSVAERGDRVPYCTLGGDSINTLSVLLHKTKVEDRLYKASEAGRLKFLEVDCLDLSSLKPGGFLSAGVAAPGSSGGERIWTPMATSGFSFSMWFRYSKPVEDNREGNIYLFDMLNPTISTSDGAHTPQSATFLSVWYDLQAQRFNVVSSTSHKGEPTCFPLSPLAPGVWHHVLLTYSPTKRTMMGRKSVIAMYVDGRPLEAEIKIDSVNIAPNARVLFGAPNSIVAASGILRGMIAHWDLGPTLMLSTVLMELDATAIFIYGPDFEGLFWGDRPQRLSLSATGTAAFALLSETGEPGSVASALRRRDIARLEAAGTITRDLGLGASTDDNNDSLGSLGLLCTIPPDCVVFAYRAGTSNRNLVRKVRENPVSKRRNWSEKLVNIARINSGNELISSDASLFGKAAVVNPRCFEDNIQWAGGPQILMPLVYSASSARSLALTLRLFRASTNRHPPNLEAMQGGGGYQILAILIQGKKFVDQKILEQSFAFAVHGYLPPAWDEAPAKTGGGIAPIPPLQPGTNWVFSDLDAMRQLLLNHQVWDLKNSGPDLPLRLVTLLNGLVGQKSIHKAFNSRRLHLVGVIRWTLHLMVEAAELYTIGDVESRTPRRKRTNSSDDFDQNDSDSQIPPSNVWYVEAPYADAVTVGGDPDNPLLHACKTLLRRVLTFMLTPGDLEAIAEATMYTVSIGAFNAKTNPIDKAREEQTSTDEGKLLPGPVARIYLLRLVEELIVDGVNEIVATGEKKDGDVATGSHAGGIANPNQTYFSAAMIGGRLQEGDTHPKHQQAQNFLSAFATVFTPVWFAALLEGCHEEATASAVLRLMVLMVQSSPGFAVAFASQGGFAPLVLSIPKFSTCSTIIISLLSELLHVTILHLPSFPILDSGQLNEVFTQENEISEVVSVSYAHFGNTYPDPSCGVFSLLAECVGRNIQLAPYDTMIGKKARGTNMAILELLSHRHNLSPAFRATCRTRDFMEPFVYTLFRMNDERKELIIGDKEGDMTTSEQSDIKRKSRRGSLEDVDKDLSPVERFVGRSSELGSEVGYAMVQLLRQILANAVVAGPVAPPLVHSLFSTFPVEATAEQVGAYHLVLIDMIRATVEDAVDLGEATALAASVGLCSVLLDKMMRGFFTSELMLQTTVISNFLLKGLTASDSAASQSISNAELTMITADAAHIARLACICSLRRSRPLNEEDSGDPQLQDTLVHLTAKNMNELMIIPKTSGLRRNASLQPAPSTSSRMYPLWQASSVSRCSMGASEFLYPDLSQVEDPLRIFVVLLMTEVTALLQDDRDDIRAATISMVVALLQQRRNIMSELLIKEVETEQGTETIDVMNRGGFGALLVAHEVATASGAASARKNYASFFDWFEKHQSKVQIVLDDIKAESARVLPGLSMGTKTADEAVEIEQQAIARRQSSAEVADRTIIGGLERAELAQRCTNRTAETHMHWKRQGFDDLASGAMRWKFLLRRLKGTCSIWEGGCRGPSRSLYSRHQQLYSSFMGTHPTSILASDDNDQEVKGELVTRWKLDLTEGYERQRRRLLPNYEFHGLYNIDEDDDRLTENHRNGAEDASSENQNDFVVVGSGMEATAELLKELNIKKVHREESELEDDFLYDGDDDVETLGTTASGSVMSEIESEAADPDAEVQAEGIGVGDAELHGHEDGAAEAHQEQNDAENVASSYELITGLLRAGDWPEQSFNVRRCTGLEVRKALLLWCRDSIYIIDGFEQSGEGLDGRIMRVEKEESSFNINLRPKDFKAAHEDDNSQGLEVNTVEGKSLDKTKASKKAGQDNPNSAVTYQHRSQRIAFSELHSVFRRRYQLQHIALEFYDIHNNGTLVAFASNEEREEILTKVLAAPLPNSIFSSFMGTSINYRKFMSSWKSKIVSQWVNGKMTNFEFLMHLNSFAGRTYNDLTQYPVFPWVIADYESEEIDLNDPRTYRDLSKPMGALGPERARQFKDRYEALSETYFTEEDPPPFHYGTHYSCAAYVLYYLMRLEPFSRLALSLQGGKFDVADRLFHNIERSWKSASQENLQDVRELIPEFYYLPDFLTNTNGFDFGVTQKGKHVHDVTLPKWAKGDPARFVRINRQALESKYVSQHLHLWIDLIFGYKQRGDEAVKALNTFVHVTYEGEVDLDAMTDPVQRASTIAQIQNFGQTPSRLERRPFQQRTVFSALKDGDKTIDYGALSYLAPLTPPFCVVGAPQRCQVKRVSTDVCKLGVSGQIEKAVGDLCLIKGQVIGVGRMCALNVAAKTYYRYGGPNYGISVHVASQTARNRELNKLLTIHDGLHRAEISVAKASLNGQWLVTGSVDSTIRLWKYNNPTIKLVATLCGHMGWKITCIDICTVFGMIVTGCAQGRVILWDLRTLTFIRCLKHSFKEENDSPNMSGYVRAATSVSINHKNGNIVTAIGHHLSVFDCNGNLLGTENSLGARPSCAVATDCPEWQEEGIVVVTGHVNGEVRFWSLDTSSGGLAVRYLMVDREHTTEITALRAASSLGQDQRQDTLLVGDSAGKMSICRTVQMENMSSKEVAEIIGELRTARGLDRPLSTASGEAVTD